ncbi:type IX secretion system anionic LPS delivery protein PorZ [Aestuariibaculum suncheonense]|uniref:ABC transporter substrate-binding protein n=1 Tax=Aestuariibaculum suncheonense TaxID=1028745 RepID=A0A8J6QDE6_9FLAO|nr:two-component regulator propeller domain-containing protein [Aestuariibaculum suncheonense]MBD0833946.1 ABC transporter substrate-binding protein [Aestuariibaculum suncheonense]
MFKKLVVFIVCIIPVWLLAQDFSASWQSHFSYYNIKEVAQGNDKIYAASENAIFSLDTQTNQLEEITTINGLSGETISTIYYSDTYELLVVGYENGLIEIVFDNDENVLTIVDIIDKPTIPPTTKRINHLNGYNNLVYISTSYGISVFDLARLEFGDTYFIGDGGTQIQVNQTAVYQDYIYAACSGGNGIRKALTTSVNLIDFSNWQTVTTGNFTGIESQLDNVYAVRSDKRLFKLDNSTLSELAVYPDQPLDLRSVNDDLIVTTKNSVFVYDTGFNLLSQSVVDLDNFPTEFTAATIGENYIYVGTKNFGVLKTEFLNPISFEEIHPEGPLLNTPFSLQATPNGVWVTFGEYTFDYNPYPLNSRGMSHLKGDEWINTPYSEVLGARCLNTITLNPLKGSQVFISSFFNGLLEVNEEVATFLYNQDNSDLESLILPSNPSYIDIRLGSTTFDNNGLLWTVTSRIKKPLKSYNPTTGQWKSYDFSSIIRDPLNDNLGFTDITIESSTGTKFIAGFPNGIIGFNENNGSQLLKSLKGEESNMPDDLVLALALDKRNQLWIGTYRGLRVLYNTSNFFDNDVQVDEIIIEEDGIAKELLYQQYITDIKVDGSNNKWIGTTDSGIFYFSSDGQKTIYHFTTDNSPLPSNSIRDISIDDVNGVVYIATTRGLVSFQSGSSGALQTLENAYAYPNPVRPGFDIVEKKVKIKDISENVNIKITDIEGNLVAEGQSRTNQRYSGYNLEIDGGTAYWNGKNLANNVVASGVYLVMLSDLDTYETKVLKIMVVR